MSDLREQCTAGDPPILRDEQGHLVDSTGRTLSDEHGFFSDPELISELHTDEAGYIVDGQENRYRVDTQGRVWKLIPPDSSFSSMPDQPERIRACKQHVLKKLIDRTSSAAPEDLSGGGVGGPRNIGSSGSMDSPFLATQRQYQGPLGRSALKRSM